jgi:hypothetical protein
MVTTTKKRALHKTAWTLGLIASIVCILFSLLHFIGYAPNILKKPLKNLTGIVSAGILSVLGFLMMSVTQLIKSGGKRAHTGGLLLLIFGFIAYLVGGAIGAIIAPMTGLLTLLTQIS